ncbi:MAG: DUF4397 domain-containing protein [Candidatus Nanopelagicales bacterium]
MNDVSTRVRLVARRGAVATAALVLPLGVAGLAAAPAMADSHGDMDATVSVLHAIPAGAGADVVDVYAGDAMLIDNFTPGSLETLTVPEGTYDLAVYADGEGPDGGTAVLEAAGVEVPGGANATVTANLDAEGNAALNVYVNDISAVAAGEARLTVRHIAAAPAVDVRADGAVIIENLVNPDEAIVAVPAATYSADVVLAGTDTVALGPADLTLDEGTNTIVYAWGSAEAGNLALATQVIDGLDGSPTGVAAGGGSTAATDALPAWTAGLMALGAMGVVGAMARLGRNRA